MNIIRQNNKGFMMAEVIVVSSIILIFLTGLYVSYNKIYTIYKSRINYYDTATLNKLAYYRNTLIDEANFDELLASIGVPLNVNEYIQEHNIEVEETDNEQVYLVKNGKHNIASDALSSFTINKTFSEYVTYISSSVKLTKSNYVMLMEKCENEKMNCKYAYLEVYDGKE